MNINITNFKSQFQPLFWNFIWYCVIHNLDYNILLPYSKNLEQLKETLFYNPNREIFSVCYDDNAFKENQNKIEKISYIINQQNNETDKKNTFKVLKICSQVAKVQLGVEEEYKEGNSFEIKRDTVNEKEDRENSVKIRPKIRMFAELEGLDNKKEDKKKEDEKVEKEEKDDKQLIKEAEEYNEALFPTSW